MDHRFVTTMNIKEEHSLHLTSNTFMESTKSSTRNRRLSSLMVQLRCFRTSTTASRALSSGKSMLISRNCLLKNKMLKSLNILCSLTEPTVIFYLEFAFRTVYIWNFNLNVEIKIMCKNTQVLCMILFRSTVCVVIILPQLWAYICS